MSFLMAWKRQLRFPRFLKLKVTYVGLQYINWCKRYFLQLQKKDYFLKWCQGGGFYLCSKTKKNNTLPWQNQHHWSQRWRLLPRKKQVSNTVYIQFLYSIVLYVVVWVFPVVACLCALFLRLTSSQCARWSCDRLMFCWCHFCSASIKKGVPSSSMISVASVALTLMTTSSSLSTKGSTTSLSSSSIVKSARQLLLRSPQKSTKLPAYCINWISIKDIRRKLKKYNEEKETGKKIEEDLSSLSEIRFTLVVTQEKLLSHVLGKCTIKWFQDFYTTSQIILIRNNLTYILHVTESYSYLLGECTIKRFQDFYTASQIILIRNYLTYILHVTETYSQWR